MKGLKNKILKILIGLGSCIVVFLLYWSTKFTLFKILISIVLILVLILVALGLCYFIGDVIVGDSLKEGR